MQNSSVALPVSASRLQHLPLGDALSFQDILLGLHGHEDSCYSSSFPKASSVNQIMILSL